MKKTDETMLAKTIGVAIAKKRGEMGLTQEEVAEKLEIGYEAVSRIERGVVVPSLARLYDFAEIFQCGVDTLLVKVSRRSVDQAAHILEILKGLNEDDRKLVIEIIEKLSAGLRSKKH